MFHELPVIGGDICQKGLVQINAIVNYVSILLSFVFSFCLCRSMFSFFGYSFQELHPLDLKNALSQFMNKVTF